MSKREIVSTRNAPSAIGPYSQAVRGGGMLFLSGQLGIDPASDKLVKGIGEQTKQALENIKAILEAAGSSLDKVVKTTVLLKDMDNFNTMNKIYANYFPKDFPARCCVEVRKLPHKAEIEIEAIALCKEDV